MLNVDPAANEVIRLLDGVTDDQLGHATPCADISVAALLDHLMSLTLTFTWGARKTAADEDGSGGTTPTYPAAEHLDRNWRTALPRQLVELAAAWRDPAAWEGTAEAGGGTMPAERMGTVVVDELVLHGWDLARATGQPFTCDEASTAAVLAFTTSFARPENVAGREGLFGPVVEVAADAPAFDRALGFSGRDPAWTPASA